jgi:hypothetical protein
MSLRFQKEDDVDREVKEERRTTPWLFIFYIVFFAVVFGLFDWLGGQSLKSFAEELGGLIVVCLFVWLISPIYEEFRKRTKEIDGKISAIEIGMNALKESDIDLLKKLTAIENKLDEIQDKR